MTPQTFSISDFCTAHSISRGLFYRAIKEGWAPRMMKLGRRRVISAEAAADWRKQREGSCTGGTHRPPEHS